MTFDELDRKLFEITGSERRHLEHPNELSERYKSIPIVEHEGQQVYGFFFYFALGGRGFWLMKESRFTPIPLHIHDVIELNYIYSGSCRQIINGVPTELREGDFCLFDCNTPHQVEPLGENDIVITIDMKKAFLTDELLRRLTSSELVTSFLAQTLISNVSSKRHLVFHAQDERIASLMRHLMCDYFDGATEEILCSYMVILFSQLMRIYREQGGEDVQSKADLFFDILNYIDRNIDAKLGDIAKRFGYSEAYLGNLIKQKTGRTFRELSLEKKLGTARLWLVTTDIPIYEIAETIGYRNLGFFYRKFREAYGCTPQEYRDRDRAASEAQERV